MNRHSDIARTHRQRGVTFLFLAAACAAFAIIPPAAGADETVHHDLDVKIIPAEHRISGTDTVTVPAEFAKNGRILFLLHGGLDLCAVDEGACLVVEEGDAANEASEITVAMNGIPDEVPVLKYAITLPGAGEGSDGCTFTLAFDGKIHHLISSGTEEYARSFSQTPGIISEDGTVLSASSFWYPRFGEDLVTFRLALELPTDRRSVTQGSREVAKPGAGAEKGLRRVVWDCPHPMDDIYLIEGAFTEYSDKSGEVAAFAFLRAPDPALAAKYLNATSQYIEMYEELIGPYPYGKFALVENFWETGYGMPSFTLLGPTVIRFPFILRSSYPHEILHNWWGNSVFVNYSEGNWCEGITAYLADHMLKEQIGQGEEYRRDALLRYRSYVRDDKDFPLTDFRSRHNAATEAVGYGKSLMLFHMLRMRLGDDSFCRGLRSFYENFRFKRASWADLEEIFSGIAGRNLQPFFRQWIERTGAPEIRIHDHDYSYSRTSGARLVVHISQVQEDEPFDVDLPVAVHFEGGEQPLFMTVEMRDKYERFTLEQAAPITRVEVDPCFDLFRRLHREETPPTIGQAFGASKVLMVLPSGEKEGLLNAWRDLAEKWSRGQEERITHVEDTALEALPGDHAVWIFGRTNRWCRALKQGIDRRGVAMTGEHISIVGRNIPWTDHCQVFTFRHPENDDLTVSWVVADRDDAIPGLSRKLPHYGKYSYLAFQGAEPNNIAKGQWPALNSPMTLVLDSEAPRGKLPQSTALAKLPVRVDTSRLSAHTDFLAGDELRGRGLGTPELDDAAEYIAGRFAEYGLKPGGEMGSFFQAWQDKVGDDDRTAILMNVIGILPGNDPSLGHDQLVVGAHYDHLGLGWPDVRKGNKGLIHNGADDNASGVAVLLELARLMADGAAPGRTIVFAAFTGEEAGLRGSRRFVSTQTVRSDKRIHSMVNLDSLGRLGERKLLVFGTNSAREWPHIVRGVGFTTGIAAESVTNDLGTGDQVSFLDAGIPAIHLFSGIHADYHRPSDDVEKLDFGGMVKATIFAMETLTYLADRKEMLTSQLEGAGSGKAQADTARHPGGAASGSGKSRDASSEKPKRASLGTMPDFAYKGKGVRIEAVNPGTPAEEAGIKPGDILNGINETRFADIRGYANALYKYKAGQTVTIHIERDGEKMELTATLAEH